MQRAPESVLHVELCKVIQNVPLSVKQESPSKAENTGKLLFLILNHR
jgi:hypothetical protein